MLLKTGRFNRAICVLILIGVIKLSHRIFAMVEEGKHLMATIFRALMEILIPHFLFEIDADISTIRQTLFMRSS